MVIPSGFMPIHFFPILFSLLHIDLQVTPWKITPALHFLSPSNLFPLFLIIIFLFEKNYFILKNNSNVIILQSFHLSYRVPIILIAIFFLFEVIYKIDVFLWFQPSLFFFLLGLILIFFIAVFLNWQAF
jgi:hypothetical protein